MCLSDALNSVVAQPNVSTFVRSLLVSSLMRSASIPFAFYPQLCGQAAISVGTQPVAESGTGAAAFAVALEDEHGAVPPPLSYLDMNRRLPLIESFPLSCLS